MLVKKGNATEWEYFYSNIEGFQYEPGYEFVLKVKEEKLENVPADASSIKYVLVKQISKEQKESDNLPPAVQQKAQVLRINAQVKCCLSNRRISDGVQLLGSLK
ncbi:lipoprotein [Bacteroides reticulotermitis JCM 10512]|uniref:Lipoprotein n=1 Tax=Bacteroides reticulotermitis JCM 10512 TaxID=1445607 RepID=W4US41_9BACE|nr:lipoprotein [Bacteroides reticulotermitis JCM 10512]